MTLRTLILATVALTPLTAQAVSLDFPGHATQAAEEIAALDSYALPLGGWTDDGMQTLPTEGMIVKQAWQIQGDGLTTLQILKPLREQLEGAGYEALFECETDSCGGFDFRYANAEVPEPAMHVDLSDFRVFSARKLGAADSEYINLMVSRSPTRGFVQLVHVGPGSDVAPIAATSTKTPQAAQVIRAAGSLAERLETMGHSVLDDVRFATGSSDLAGNDFPTLQALADYLIANPTRTVTLVGHTDSVGGLAGNVSLSKKRAQSVARYLTGTLNVPSAQVSSDGIGYLAPIATNLTDTGRETNRRVEVILTSTQ